MVGAGFWWFDVLIFVDGRKGFALTRAHDISNGLPAQIIE